MSEFNYVQIIQDLETHITQFTKEAKELTSKATDAERLANENDKNVGKFPEQATSYTKLANDHRENANDYKKLATSCIVESNKLKNIVKKLKSNEAEVLKDFQNIHDAMERCKQKSEQNSACQILLTLIEKYKLKTILPYSKSWATCGGDLRRSNS